MRVFCFRYDRSTFHSGYITMSINPCHYRLFYIYIPLWLYYNEKKVVRIVKVHESTFHSGYITIRSRTPPSFRKKIYIPLWLYYNPSGQPNRQPHIKTLTFCLSHFIRTQHSYFFTLLILKNSLLSSRFHLLSLPHIIYIITRRQSQKPTCLIFFYANKLLLQPTFIPR